MLSSKTYKKVDFTNIEEKGFGETHYYDTNNIEVAKLLSKLDDATSFYNRSKVVLYQLDNDLTNLIQSLQPFNNESIVNSILIKDYNDILTKLEYELNNVIRESIKIESWSETTKLISYSYKQKKGPGTWIVNIISCKTKNLKVERIDSSPLRYLKIYVGEDIHVLNKLSASITAVKHIDFVNIINANLQILRDIVSELDNNIKLVENSKNIHVKKFELIG